MHPVLLTDFGSTCTKLTAFDVDSATVLGSAQSFTTARTDLMEGFDKAFHLLPDACQKLDFKARLACSSAAGGLNMVAVGLVPSLTAQAARLAAFGAGAKVTKTYSYQLTASDTEAIAKNPPDILLLTGGTDGGNREVILHNARALAQTPGHFPILYGGNRAAADEAVAIIADSEHLVFQADNVMPNLGTLNIEPAQAHIRDLFLKRIVLAKGLSRAEALIDGILMPTPAAVLTALTLLSDGLPGQRGLGDLMAADLGGATTDIYSIADGLPTDPSTMLHGLPEPRVKRTVEGDIGMRYSAKGVIEAAGIDQVAEECGLSTDLVLSIAADYAADADLMPDKEDRLAMDKALAVLSLRLGIGRHAGTYKEVYTPIGPVSAQTGKDLRDIDTLLVTGGALIYNDDAAGLVTRALTGQAINSLTPRAVKVYKDSGYILSAMGLLAGYAPQAAFQQLITAFGKGGQDGACQ